MEHRNDTSYNPNEDLEKGYLIQKDYLHSSDTNSQKTQENQNPKLQLIEKSTIYSSDMLRILNCISIILLLLSFSFVLTRSIQQTKYEFILFQQASNNSLKSNSQYLILLVSLSLLIISLIAAFLRNAFISTKFYHTKEELEKVLINSYSCFYCLANIFFSISIILNYKQIYKEENCLMLIIALIFYFNAYYSLMQSKFSCIKGYFNHLSLTLNIGFTTGWCCCFLAIAISNILGLKDLNENMINKDVIYIQLSLCIVVVLTIVYAADVYLTCIVLTFQIGNIINVQSSDELKYFRISLCLVVFNILCLIYAIWQTIGFKKNEENKENDELQNNYLQDTNNR